MFPDRFVRLPVVTVGILVVILGTSFTAWSQADTDAETTAAPSPSSVAPEPVATPKLTIGAGAILWLYQPFTKGTKNNVEVFWANLVVDGTLGAFGLHLEPRVRDTKLRSFFAGTAWLQEAYAFADVPYAKIKVGKIYGRLGLFWDNSFYGNVQVYDGLKLAPDYGISIEGSAGRGWGVNYVAQYFVVDGGTNVSLAGRDTLSVAGSHRRNEAIARVEPFAALAENATLKVGISGAFLQADLPGGKNDVYRAAADATLSVGGLTVRGEVLRQNGRTVTDFPYAGTPATAMTAAVAGRASSKNTYDLFTLRYHFSLGSYEDVGVKERMHVPAISVKANDNLSVLTEVVFWDRSAPEGSSTVDHSLNVTLYGHF